jgi:hypothetical protein
MYEYMLPVLKHGGYFMVITKMIGTWPLLYHRRRYLYIVSITLYYVIKAILIYSPSILLTISIFY